MAFFTRLILLFGAFTLSFSGFASNSGLSPSSDSEEEESWDLSNIPPAEEVIIQKIAQKSEAFPCENARILCHSALELYKPTDIRFVESLQDLRRASLDKIPCVIIDEDPEEFLSEEGFLDFSLEERASLYEGWCFTHVYLGPDLRLGQYPTQIFLKELPTERLTIFGNRLPVGPDAPLFNPKIKRIKFLAPVLTINQRGIPEPKGFFRSPLLKQIVIPKQITYSVEQGSRFSISNRQSQNFELSVLGNTLTLTERTALPGENYRHSTTLVNIDPREIKKLIIRPSAPTEDEEGNIPPLNVIPDLWTTLPNLEEITVEGLHKKGFFLPRREVFSASKQQLRNELRETPDSLKSITLPNVRWLETYAFPLCNGLERVSIPDLRILETNAFAECPNLKEVTLPDTFLYFVPGSNVGSPRELPFLSLREENGTLYVTARSHPEKERPDIITIHPQEISRLILITPSGMLDSLSRMEAPVLGLHFPALEEIIVDGFSKFPHMRDLGGTRFRSAILRRVSTLEAAAFKDCKNLHFVNAPDVRTLQSWAFFGCESLEELTLPLLQEMGVDALKGCQNLGTETVNSLQEQCNEQRLPRFMDRPHREFPRFSQNYDASLNSGHLLQAPQSFNEEEEEEREEEVITRALHGSIPYPPISPLISGPRGYQNRLAPNGLSQNRLISYLRRRSSPDFSSNRLDPSSGYTTHCNPFRPGDGNLSSCDLHFGIRRPPLLPLPPLLPRQR